MKFSAVILAGGKSSRMGRDKAGLPMEGRPLLERQLTLVRELGAAEIFLSAGSNDYSLVNCRTVRDCFANCGPLADIEACTELVEILPKYGPQVQVPDSAGVTLTEARTLLAARSVRGLQLRYRYDGAEWWDTLMVAGEHFRVVRIRHDFSQPIS